MDTNQIKTRFYKEYKEDAERLCKLSGQDIYMCKTLVNGKWTKEFRLLPKEYILNNHEDAIEVFYIAHNYDKPQPKNGMTVGYRCNLEFANHHF